MFGLFKKKAPENLDPRFVFPEDLLFAWYKQGDPWKDHTLKESIRGRFPLRDFSKAYKKCIKYGLVRVSTTEERFERATMNKLKEICSDLGLKAKRSKPETQTVILDAVPMESLAKYFPEETFAITDRTRELLEKHKYVLFCAEHFPGETIDYGEMCAMVNTTPDASLYDIVMAGFNKKEFIERYVEDYMSDEDYEDLDASDRADIKRTAKEDAKEEYQEIMDKIKALKKEGLL